MSQQDELMQQVVKQYQQLEQHINNVEQALMELQATEEALEELKKTKEDEEILAPIANGIFIEANIKEPKALRVNIGNNIVQEKTIEETQKLLKKQKEELEKGRADAEDKMNQLHRMLQE